MVTVKFVGVFFKTVHCSALTEQQKDVVSKELCSQDIDGR